MWVAFYLPWAVTIAHPVAGFVTTTLFMVYHYAFHREIVQRIELSVLSNPVKIFAPDYQKHHNGPTHSKATSSGKTQPCESPTEMEEDGLPKTGEGHARRTRQASQEGIEMPQTEKEVSPYVWNYATW